MKDIGDLSFKAVLEHANIGVIIHDWDTSIIYINPTGLELLGLTYEEAIGLNSYNSTLTLIDEEGKVLMIENYPVNKVKQSRERVSNQFIGLINHTKSEVSWFLVNAYFEGDDKKEKFIITTVIDISESKERFCFEDVVENTQDMVVITDAKNISYPEGPKIVYVNKAFETLTGYSSSEVIGETPRILQGNLTDSKAKMRISEALMANQEVTETLLNYDSRGRPYWVQMNIIPLKNKYNEVTHFAAIERDVSKSKFQTEQLEKRNNDLKELKRNLEEIVQQRTFELQKAKSQLEKLAFFDPLTNIPNRRFFSQQVIKLVKGCSRRGDAIAFGLLDIDNFKSINDTYGHNVGDSILVNLGKLLTILLRADDVFCRFGGEEFAFAVVLKKPLHVKSVADKLIDAIRKMKSLTDIDNSINITVSMGINVIHANENINIDDEIKKADVAMYKAKKLGKDRYNLILS